MPIQLDATTGGLLVNIRRGPAPYYDFEVGTDLIPFRSLDAINAADAVPVSRPSLEPNPWTGVPSIAVKYPAFGGFVPHGARLLAGTAHPHAGSGFGICQVGFYPADFALPMPEKVGYHLELQQFRYDGTVFTASAPQRMAALRVGDTEWQISAPGLSAALCDGPDLLFAAECLGVPGVARFQHGPEGWLPTSFVAVAAAGSEPSLRRDTDGALLYSCRSGDLKLSLWRSTDGGRTWESRFSVKALGAECPLVLNQARDGTPFFTTTTAAVGGRGSLQIVPVNAARDGIEAPLMLRDGTAEFGAAPNGRGWYMDHGMGAVLRLADGAWHAVLAYRVADLGELSNMPTSSPHSGLYVEEVFSAGAPCPTTGVLLGP